MPQARCPLIEFSSQFGRFGQLAPSPVHEAGKLEGRIDTALAQSTFVPGRGLQEIYRYVLPFS